MFEEEGQGEKKRGRHPKDCPMKVVYLHCLAPCWLSGRGQVESLEWQDYGERCRVEFSTKGCSLICKARIGARVELCK